MSSVSVNVAGHKPKVLERLQEFAARSDYHAQVLAPVIAEVEKAPDDADDLSVTVYSHVTYSVPVEPREPRNPGI